MKSRAIDLNNLLHFFQRIVEVIWRVRAWQPWLDQQIEQDPVSLVTALGLWPLPPLLHGPHSAFSGFRLFFLPASCLENPTHYTPTLFRSTHLSKYRANHELWASISKVPGQQAPAKDANQDLSTSLTSSQLYVPFTGCGR